MNARSPVNFRVFLIVAVAVIGAVFCAYAYLVSRVAGIAVGVVYIVALGSGTAVASVMFAKKRAKVTVLVALAVSTLLGVSAFAFGAVYGNMRGECEDLGGYHEINGRVCAADVRSGDYRLNLEDLYFDGKAVPGVMRVTFSASDKNSVEFVDYGDRISFGAYVSVTSLVGDGKVNGYSYRTGIMYYASADPENIKIDFGEPNAIERLLGGLRKLLVDNMGSRYGNIAFSMITGDKSGLDATVSDTFSAAGLGHIMAVSGLHVGFLIMLVNFALCKVDKRIRFPIICVLLVGYMIIADFSPSVVRATVMAVISGFALFVGGRRDLLSSLACAFSLILAFKPFYLFESGFLLSFGALFGIAMFANAISRFFVSHGAHNKVANGIGSAISVQAGIIPAQVYFFNVVQPLAIIVNIVMIPYVSVVFVSIIVCSIVGAIPYLGIVLKLPMYLLMPLDFVAQGIAAVPFSSFTVFSTAAIFLCYPVMFCASEFFMMPKGKLAVKIYSLAACLMFCFVSAPMPSDSIVVPLQSIGVESLVCIGCKTYYVGYVDSVYSIEQTLKDNKRAEIDAVFLLGMSDKTAERVIELADSVDIRRVYYTSFGDAGKRLIDNGINFVLLTGDDAAEFAPVYFGGAHVGYEFRNVLFAAKNVDSGAFAGYDAVRAATVTEPVDGVSYLCNHFDGENSAVLDLDRGAYRYIFN